MNPDMNKKLIYAIIAAVVLGLGIFLGIIISGGGDEKEKTETVLADNSGNKNTGTVEAAVSTDTNTEGSNSSSVNNNSISSEIKASDIGKPIFPEDENAGLGTEDPTVTDDSDEIDDQADSPKKTEGTGKDEVRNDSERDQGKKESDNQEGKNNNASDDIEGSGNEDDNTEPDNDDNNTGSGNENNDSKPDNEETGDDDIKKPEQVLIVKPDPVLNTGNLTETGSGYEGIKGTGDYNYGEALQKSLLFYELQRSGKLPENVRCNWRGDSCVNDGSDAGLDLTGGWYDAGDNVKFNLPMSYTSSMLGWSIIDDAKAYEESGQLTYALQNIKWANDYFIKCHPSDNVYYYQVGDGNQDHSYWGAAETVEYRMSRPSYKVTTSSPGSTVCGETAASLAICSIIYKNIDKSYSDICLKHAKSLYKFAFDSKSDAGYTAANGFYTSWSGFYDELAWAGAWLYCATGDESYIKKAESAYENAGHDYDWSMCWDDVHIGAALMLAKLTDKQKYKDDMEQHLDWWAGLSADHITYSPKGLAWLDNWGSLRYATTTGFIALTYAESGLCSASKAKAYTEFAEKQVNYALGSSGRSYMVGFGKNSPKNPHHRTAQGSYCDNMNEPSTARHTLYGALVGGPDANDGYNDTVSDYNKNEVACDYNAGFTGLLAKMYKKYHGQTLKDFGAVENVDINEFYVQGGINVDGSDFMEIRSYICNVSAWPARGGEKLEFRYYVDLSEVYKAGGSASDISITTNYMAAGKSAGLKCWDEKKHIYYLSVEFSDSVIYPGGQDKYKKEIQVRLRNNKGVWDNTNDPSFVNMTKGGNSLLTGTALYEKGKLVFGSEPAKGDNAGTTVVSDPGQEDDDDEEDEDDPGTGSGTAENESVAVSIEYDTVSSSSSGISGRLNILNNSDGSLALKDIKILFYFTNEEGKDLTFECYHTCINGAKGAYTPLSQCKGNFKKASGKNTDTLCEISYSDKNKIEEKDILACNFAIHHTDWSNMNLTNDYSVKDAANIVIMYKDKVIFGKKP